MTDLGPKGLVELCEQCERRGMWPELTSGMKALRVKDRVSKRVVGEMKVGDDLGGAARLLTERVLAWRA